MLQFALVWMKFGAQSRSEYSPEEDVSCGESHFFFAKTGRKVDFKGL
jgi:hypothetical protein